MVTSVLFAIGGVRALRPRAAAHFFDTQTYENLYYLPPPEWLEVFSLGHREALADLVWIKALVYYGEELQHRGDIDHWFRYGEAVVRLDPHFLRAYRWVGMAGLYRPGLVSVDDIRRAIRFMERGGKLHPDDGQLAYDIAANLMYELAPRLEEPEEKNDARARGMDYLQTAVRLGAGPPWMVLSGADALGKLGRADQEIRHLQEMYSVVTDPRVRADIELRLERLIGVAGTEGLRLATEDLERRRQHDFPYVDPELYRLLGPRPPMDETAFLRRRFAPED